MRSQHYQKRPTFHFTYTTSSSPIRWSPSQSIQTYSIHSKQAVYLYTFTEPHDLRPLYPKLPPGSEQRHATKLHSPPASPTIHCKISPAFLSHSPLHLNNKSCLLNMNWNLTHPRRNELTRASLTLSGSQSSRF